MAIVASCKTHGVVPHVVLILQLEKVTDKIDQSLLAGMANVGLELMVFAMEKVAKDSKALDEAEKEKSASEKSFCRADTPFSSFN